MHSVTSEVAEAEPGFLAPSSSKWIPKPMPDGETRVEPLVEADPTKTVQLDSDLDPTTATAILATLWENRDIFAWGPEDLPGVPREII